MFKNRVELYEHNKETYESIKEVWEVNNRVAILQATGTGKTFVISRVVEDFKKSSILILAPTHHILSHIKANCVDCNDITYMTYTKLLYLSNKYISSMKYDLIVLDEFHRCGAKEWGKTIEKLLNNNQSSKILGATATHIRYLDGAVDMADELFDNYVACKMDLMDAINKGLLPMPFYVGSLYDVNEELNSIRCRIEGSKNSKSEKVDLLKKLEEAKAWSLVNGVPSIIKKYISDDRNKFIVFCKNKSHLDEMKSLLPEWFKKAGILKPIKQYEVSYINGVKYNEKEIQNFSNGKDDSIHLLFSIDILNEGVHIPDVSGVFLMRETSSPTVFYQQIGRAMSVGMNKNPLILDFVNNFNALKTEEFKEMLNESRKKLKTANEKIEEVDFTIYDETIDFRFMLDNILGRLVSSWEAMYEELKVFYLKNGHTYIDRKNPKYKTLFRWINKQRVLYAKGELDENRIKLLEDIDFVWNVHDKRWLDMYSLLLEFYRKNNHTRVSESIDKKLSVWCSVQREMYRKNKLEQYQINLLNEIDFMWNVLDSVWNERYKELLDYKKKYGHVNVPRRYPENSALANWCQMQKSNYKLRMENEKITVISDERIKLLEEIGFIWNLEDYNWNKNLSRLSDYYNETGDYLHKGNMEKSLRDWTVRQRQSYRKGKLSDERIEKLESIGFVWDLLSAK